MSPNYTHYYSNPSYHTLSPCSPSFAIPSSSDLPGKVRIPCSTPAPQDPFLPFRKHPTLVHNRVSPEAQRGGFGWAGIQNFQALKFPPPSVDIPQFITGYPDFLGISCPFSPSPLRWGCLIQRLCLLPSLPQLLRPAIQSPVFPNLQNLERDWAGLQGADCNATLPSDWRHRRGSPAHGERLQVLL